MKKVKVKFINTSWLITDAITGDIMGSAVKASDVIALCKRQNLSIANEEDLFPDAVKPKKYKLKLTVYVNVATHKDVEDAIAEFSSETDYSFSDTENVDVIDTEFHDCELI